MNKLECPACEELFRYDGDYDGFKQDTEHEFECPECETKFMATVYWDLCFTGERIKPDETSGL